jgi:lipoprotein-releasing system permease protein
MHLPYELLIGWRYTRVGRAGRRNGFISFISGVSMLGIALGVAALIVVLSVMNGFQKEVRDRMFSVIAQVEVFGAQAAALTDWRATAEAARRHPEVVGAAPFVAAQALVAQGSGMRGAIVRGILPADEATVTALGAQVRSAARLEPGAWGIVLGGELARGLGVHEGDRVTVVTPNGQVTPAGVVPRLKQVVVVGIFDSGHHEYDNGLALMHLEDAARLFRVEGPAGVQLKLRDQQQAPEVATQLSALLGGAVEVRDWTRTHRNWYAAVQLEKRMMSIILTLIVAVAAFNLVSTLVMTVTDKHADIAILRTLGASPGSVMAVFMVQGAASGIIGTLGGLALGLLVAFNIDVIVPVLDLFGAGFARRIPSLPLANDIALAAVSSLALAFVATLYPSWRASRVQPAQALRYE